MNLADLKEEVVRLRSEASDRHRGTHQRIDDIVQAVAKAMSDVESLQRELGRMQVFQRDVLRLLAKSGPIAPPVRANKSSRSKRNVRT